MFMKYGPASFPATLGPGAEKAEAARRDAFLFAEIGRLPTGLPLTTVSMLAQQDVDPWAEADYLTHCRAEEAVVRLASHLDGAALDLGNRRARLAAASSLLRLLYGSAPQTAQPAAKPRQSTQSKRQRSSDTAWFLMALVTVVTLLAVSREKPEAAPAPAEPAITVSAPPAAQGLPARNPGR